MKARILQIMTLISILTIGCAQETVNIDVMHDEGKPVMALDYRDSDQAASQLVQSMLASGISYRSGNDVTAEGVRSDFVSDVDSGVTRLRTAIGENYECSQED
ncbi:hypothetical protein ES703_80106 [subsurface metagenome]